MSNIDKKIISVLVIAILLLSTVMPTVSLAADNSTEIIIKDTTLRAELLSRLDVNNDNKITQKELNNLYYIYLHEGIKDLTGLEYAKNLQNVDIVASATYPDLTPIEKVSSVSFNAGNMTNINLEVLKKFPKIETLHLTLNGEGLTVNFSALTEITTLESLWAYGDVIPTMDVVKEITSLRDFGIYPTYINDESLLPYDLAGLSNLSNLEYLSLDSVKITSVSEIGKLANLMYLDFSDVRGVSDLSTIKSNTKLEYLSLYSTDTEDISFLNGNENIVGVNFYNLKIKDINVLETMPNLQHISLEQINFNGADQYKNVGFEDYTAYIGESARVISTFVDCPVELVDHFTFTSDNDNITIYENGTFLAEKIGETTITATCKEYPSVTKTFKITVNGIAADQALGTEMGSYFVDESYILKANGDLLRLHSDENKVEKISTNVKKAVYDTVYDDDYIEGFNYSLLLKNDGTVEYTFNGQKSTITDAKDIYKTGYLKKDGTFVKINLDGTWTTVTDNVENLFGSFLVKNDGKTYTVENTLVADFRITEANYMWIVDENGVLWRAGSSVEYLREIDNNFDHFVGGETYMDKDGVLKSAYTGQETEWVEMADQNLRLSVDGILYMNGKEILTNVVNMQLASDWYWHFVILREDASIWMLRLEGEGKLIKVEEVERIHLKASSELVSTEIVEDGLLVPVLTGFDTKDLSIQNALLNELQEGYTVRVYNLNGELLSNTDKLHTGASIDIINAEGEIVGFYGVIIYGDTTGKGTPGAKDALMIIKNNLGDKELSGVFLEAARVRPETRAKGGVPGAGDALAIIKMKLS